MKKYNVDFMGGQSAYGNFAVDYMISNVKGIELYAEERVAEEGEEIDPDAEDERYELLKAGIIDEATKKGIDPACLKFQWD